MNKYKVGDKFIVEIAKITENNSWPYVLKGIEGIPGIVTESFLEQFKKVDMTAEEAWKVAKKLCNMDGEQRMKILGSGYYHMGKVYKDFTPQEAKAKIEAWEKSKEIQVGDVVVTHSDRTKAVVLNAYEELCVVYTENGIVEEYERSTVKKAGTIV